MKSCSALLLAIVFTIGACAPQETTSPTEESGDAETGKEKSLEEMREEAWAKIDKRACEEKGGDVRPEGMLGLPRCVIPYADAGEICADANDCEGRCLADDSVTDYDSPKGAMKGLCEVNDSPFGCYAEINDGALGAALCVD